MVAGIKLLERTGIREFQIRYSDDEQPVVWFCVVKWFLGPSGRPVAKNKMGRTVYETASALNPVDAVLRLCDQVIDGGYCDHCKRPSGVTDHWQSDMPLAKEVCWYVYDPETQIYRRSCEGDVK